MTDTPLSHKTLIELVSDAHQVVLNAPREKDAADEQTMELLEEAYLRLSGRAS